MASDLSSFDDSNGAGGDRKVKLICSYGGKILPRPSDNILRHAGGESRIFTIRRDSSLPEILQKVVEVFGGPVVLRYQLPEEGLDSLASLSTPDDLENMMEEYDKLAAKDEWAKLRVYLFSPSEVAAMPKEQQFRSADQGQSTRYVDEYIEAVNGIVSCLLRRESFASVSSALNSDGTAAVNSAAEGPLLSLSQTNAGANDQSTKDSAVDSVDLNELLNATQPVLPPASLCLSQAHISTHEARFKNSVSSLSVELLPQFNLVDVPTASHVSVAEGRLPPASQPSCEFVTMKSDLCLEENPRRERMQKLPIDPKHQPLSQTSQPELPPVMLYALQASVNSNPTPHVNLHHLLPASQQNAFNGTPSSHVSAIEDNVPPAFQHNQGSLQIVVQPVAENSDMVKVSNLPSDSRFHLLSQPPPMPPPRFLAPSLERNESREVLLPSKDQTLRLEGHYSCQKGLCHVHSETSLPERVNGFVSVSPATKMTLQGYHSEDLARMRATKMVDAGTLVSNVVELQAGNLASSTPLGPHSLTGIILTVPNDSEKAAAFIDLDHDTLPSLKVSQDPSESLGTMLNLKKTHEDALVQKKPELPVKLDPHAENKDHFFFLQTSSLDLSKYHSGVLADIPQSNWNGSYQEMTRLPQVMIAENVDHSKTLPQPSLVGLISLPPDYCGTKENIHPMQKLLVQTQASIPDGIKDRANPFFQPTPAGLSNNSSGVLNTSLQPRDKEAFQEQQQFPYAKLDLKQEVVAKDRVCSGSLVCNLNFQSENQVIHKSVPVYSCSYVGPVAGVMETSYVNLQDSAGIDDQNPIIQNGSTNKDTNPEILPLVVENGPIAKPKDGCNVMHVNDVLFSVRVPNGKSGLPIDPLTSDLQNCFHNPSSAQTINISKITEENGSCCCYHEAAIGTIGMPLPVGNDEMNDKLLNFQPMQASNDTAIPSGTGHLSCSHQSSNVELITDKTISDSLFMSRAGNGAIGIPLSVHNDTQNNNLQSFPPKEVVSAITMPLNGNGQCNYDSHSRCMEQLKDQSLGCLFFNEAENRTIRMSMPGDSDKMNNDPLMFQPMELSNGISVPLSGNRYSSSRSQCINIGQLKDKIASNSVLPNNDSQRDLGTSTILPSRSGVVSEDSAVIMGMQSDVYLPRDKGQEKSALTENVAWLLQDSWNKDLYAEVAQQLKDNQQSEHDMNALAMEEVASTVPLSTSIPNFVSRESFEHNPHLNNSVKKGNNLLQEDNFNETTNSKNNSKKADNNSSNVNNIEHLQVINNSDLEELQELGAGTYGTVYHGKWRGSDVAIKKLNDRAFVVKESDHKQARADFRNEAYKLASLHHPNVLAFYGVVLDGPGGSIETVTEFMVNGSLRNALQKNDRSLDWHRKLIIAMDAAFGMEYLHSRNIIHFDLKSDNLLVNLSDPHRPICKVADLGLAKVKYETLKANCMRGTLPYMAPELLGGEVTEKIDVFAFGIVMWELLTCEEPYSDMHYGVILGGIIKGKLRPEVPESCDPEWRSLMEQCWASEPTKRPSFTEIARRLRAMESSLCQKE